MSYLEMYYTGTYIFSRVESRGGRYIGIYSLYSVTADLVGTISAILDNSIYRNPPLRAHKMQLANNGRLIFSPNGIVARWS